MVGASIRHAYVAMSSNCVPRTGYVQTLRGLGTCVRPHTSSLVRFGRSSNAVQSHTDSMSNPASLEVCAQRYVAQYLITTTPESDYSTYIL